MRACPSCRQLIHDAAVVCRFCDASVGDESALPPVWREFARDFHEGSRAERLELWGELSPQEKSYAQKVLGLESPELLSFSSQPNLADQMEESEEVPEPVAPIDPRLEEFNRLLGGYGLLAIMTGLLFLSVGIARFADVYILDSANPLEALAGPARKEKPQAKLQETAPDEGEAEVQAGSSRSRQSGARSRSSSSRSMVNPVSP